MSEKIGVKEAAEILGVSKKTVYSRLRSGQISAEKVDTKHGKKWVIDKDDLTEQATAENEVVEVKEINKLIDKDQLVNDLLDAIEARNKGAINSAMEKIDETVSEQNKAIKEQNKLIREQSSRLESMETRLEELHKQQNKSILDKIKSLFNI